MPSPGFQLGSLGSSLSGVTPFFQGRQMSRPDLLRNIFSRFLGNARTGGRQARARGGIRPFVGRGRHRRNIGLGSGGTFGTSTFGQLQQPPTPPTATVPRQARARVGGGPPVMPSAPSPFQNVGRTPTGRTLGEGQLGAFLTNGFGTPAFQNFGGGVSSGGAQPLGFGAVFGGGGAFPQVPRSAIGQHLTPSSQSRGLIP